MIDREDPTPQQVVSERHVMMRIMTAEAEYRGGLASIRRQIWLRSVVGAIALFMVALGLLVIISLRSVDRITSGEVHRLFDRLSHDIERLEDHVITKKVEDGNE